MISITPHRPTTSNDTPLLDLLQLGQLGWLPGRIKTRDLQKLWGVTQPSVSRRMSAVAALGLVTVISRFRCYEIRLEALPAPMPLPRLRLPGDSQRRRDAAAQRWDAIRQRLRAGR